jgi:hypothetical protein
MIIKRRHIGLGWALVLILAALAPAASAQQRQLLPGALGQIADEVLNALIPPDQLLSRVPVAKRKIIFDFERTMAAFMKVGTPAASFPDLHMQTPVELGTADLLDDCTQFGLREHPCARLGWRVYTWIAPVSVTDSVIVVRASVAWPERGGLSFQPDLAPEGRATLVGFTTEVHLVRTPTGKWKFSKQGAAAVG